MADAKNQFYSSLIVNSVLNAVFSLTAVALNILTIYVMRKSSSLPPTLRTLLLSLAVSDLSVGLLAQPLYVEKLVTALLQNSSDDPASSLRKCTDFIRRVILYASFFSISAVGVDRFLAVHLHLRYQELVTHKRVVAGVVLIWVFSALLSMLRIVWVDMGLCGRFFSWFLLYFFNCGLLQNLLSGAAPHKPNSSFTSTTSIKRW